MSRRVLPFMLMWLAFVAIAYASPSSTPVTTVAADSGSPESKMVSGLIWFSVVVVVVTVAVVIIAVMRKGFFGEDDMSEAESAFSLAHLRELHKNGMLTDEEYEKAKAATISAVSTDIKQAGGVGGDTVLFVDESEIDVEVQPPREVLGGEPPPLPDTDSSQVHRMEPARTGPST